ncbi:unnamed protein product, partial [Rangifer tarandus platyrhynchus]
PQEHCHQSRRNLRSPQQRKAAPCAPNQLEMRPDSPALTPEPFPVPHSSRPVAPLPSGNSREAPRTLSLPHFDGMPHIPLTPREARGVHCFKRSLPHFDGMPHIPLTPREARGVHCFQRNPKIHVATGNGPWVPASHREASLLPCQSSSPQQRKAAPCAPNQLEMRPNSPALIPEPFPIPHSTRPVARLPSGNSRDAPRTL